MKSGPAKQPTALRIIRGNPSGRPLNGREPKPLIELPAAPKHLTPAALAEWNRLGPQLVRLRLISNLDRAAFAMYCQSWARHLEAEEQIAKASALAFTHNGYPIVNPWVTISKQAQDLCVRLLSEFGLTPSSRSRITTDAAPEEDDGSEAKGFRF